MGTRFALLMILAGSALAQTSEVSLRVESASGRQFHVGETISLKLTFESSDADKWTVFYTGRRSLFGREEFLVSPKEGTSDPLSFRKFAGGSEIGGAMVLGKPWSMDGDLNQWVRFERPGRYRVRALVHVSDKQGQNLAVDSNEIEIEIVATAKEWSAEQLWQAVAVVDAPARTDQQTFNARASAVRTIWYLDTPESVREAARLLGALDEQTAQPLQLALQGSAHQDVAIAAMKQLLRSPDQPVTSQFLQTLASLEAMQKARPEPGADPGAPFQQLRTELGSVVERKRGDARAISLKALLDGVRPEEVSANMRAEIAGVFPDLPFQQQKELLTSQWKRIAGPAMIPVLLRIYESAPAVPGLQQSLAGEAVRRLYELDPARARTLIINEMKLEQPRLRDESLTILADATLPDLDPVLLDHLQGNGRSQQLIARYATADILEGVKAWYAKQRQSSSPALTAYFLRVDPAWGERVLRQALSERSNPHGLWQGVIGKTAEYYVSPEWEKVAIEALSDPAVEVKADAVRALGEHGSAVAQQTVMEAFHAWHEWWKDRPAETAPERRYDQWFLNATAHAKNWIANGETLEKIRGYCITPNCRTEAEQYLRQWADGPKLYLGESDAGDVSAGFAQYIEYSLDAARLRLLQLPAGTRLKWNLNVRHTPEIDAWVSTIESDLAARGVVITQ
jgi:hypothetical protein